MGTHVAKYWELGLFPLADPLHGCATVVHDSNSGRLFGVKFHVHRGRAVWSVLLLPQEGSVEVHIRMYKYMFIHASVTSVYIIYNYMHMWMCVIVVQFVIMIIISSHYNILQ